MPAPAELTLSIPFKRAQRALDQWMEPGMGLHEAAFRLRSLVPALDAEEVGRLKRWLQWRQRAARANGQSAQLARVEKLQSIFDARIGTLDRPPKTGARDSAKAAPRLAHSA